MFYVIYYLYRLGQGILLTAIVGLSCYDMWYFVTEYARTHGL